MTRTLLTSLALTFTMATSAFAITPDALPTPAPAPAPAPARPASAARVFGPAVASSDIESRLFGKDQGQRPKVLLGLYASLGVMNSLDLISTHKALKNGAVEANPTMQGGTSTQLLVKVLASASTVLLAEQLWKKNKMAAIATMIAANGLLAAVSVNNLHNAALAHK